MASISSDPKGNRTIQFIGGDGKRRSVRLGKMPLKTAREIKTKVELLNNAAISLIPPDTETARWIGGLLPALYDKLANVGLVPKRAIAEQAKLGSFLDSYIAGRSDVKGATAIVYGHTRRCLIDYFGGSKLLADITPGDADEWRRYLSRPKDAEGQGLGPNTVRRRCGVAKQFFRAALRRKLIAENPFADMKGMTVQGNRERFYFVSRADAEKVSKACPDHQWRLLFALSRYAGLRCPTEHLSLRWGDVDWKRGRITIRSPKTEHHEGKGERVIPLFPELRPYLQAVLDELLSDFDPKLKRLSEQPIITRYRDTNANLRTQLCRIIRKAGLTPWPKLFNNLRSTRQTELSENHQAHVVCAWMGNSVRVADEHYLQVTDEHFLEALQNPVQHPPASDCIEPHGESESLENEYCAEAKVGDAGLEPATSTL